MILVALAEFSVASADLRHTITFVATAIMTRTKDGILKPDARLQKVYRYRKTMIAPPITTSAPCSKVRLRHKAPLFPRPPALYVLAQRQ